MTLFSAVATSAVGVERAQALGAGGIVIAFTPSLRAGRYTGNVFRSPVAGDILQGIAPGYRISVDAKTRFVSLVVPHLNDAYGLARVLTGNRTDAEDVVQEACLRAFRVLDSVMVGNARAWLLTIVHNTAYSWLAKNR